MYYMIFQLFRIAAIEFLRHFVEMQIFLSRLGDISYLDFGWY